MKSSGVRWFVSRQTGHQSYQGETLIRQLFPSQASQGGWNKTLKKTVRILSDNIDKTMSLPFKLTPEREPS